MLSFESAGNDADAEVELLVLQVVVEVAAETVVVSDDSSSCNISGWVRNKE